MTKRLVAISMAFALAGSAFMGCASTDEDVSAPTPGTASFLEGVEATLVRPAEAPGELPLVVLVPSGGWSTARVETLSDLADDLAARGAAVVTMTYRTSDVGEYFPVPVEDVACGLAYGVQAVAALDVSEIVLGGHSAGATMAALVALAPQDFAGSECPYEPVAPDALIAIAGPYDITKSPQPPWHRFFGGPEERDPETWTEGNPMAYADRRPDLPALLIHGTADYTVPISHTEDFSAALYEGGHEVATDYSEGATHLTVIGADVAGPAIADWLGLP